MKAPQMSLQSAKEYRRFWLLNQQKYNFIMPSYIQEAQDALDWYQANPNYNPVVAIVEKPVEKVPRGYRKRQRIVPTLLGPLQLADLRQHPELTLKQMAERIGCSYSHMTELARINNIEHFTPSHHKRVA